MHSIILRLRCTHCAVSYCALHSEQYVLHGACLCTNTNQMTLPSDACSFVCAGWTRHDHGCCPSRSTWTCQTVCWTCSHNWRPRCLNVISVSRQVLLVTLSVVSWVPVMLRLCLPIRCSFLGSYVRVGCTLFAHDFLRTKISGCCTFAVASLQGGICIEGSWSKSFFHYTLLYNAWLCIRLIPLYQHVLVGWLV